MLARRLSGLLLIAVLGFAQQKPELAGDYAGVLAPLHVKLHLVASHDGTITGTVDSPDQNLYGLQCTNFHISGQSLSFDVPMVHGTWIGFVSEDGSKLSGMWNQGSPMPLNLTRVSTAAATSNGAAASQAGPGEVKWDDYIFKFNPSGTMAQVYEGGKVVGTILTMNGQQQVLPLPGTDADKLKKSFEDYKVFAARSHSESGSAGTATSAASPGPSPPAMGAPSPTQPSPMTMAATSSPSPVKEVATPASAIRFDEATHSIIVPRPDGVTVTFVDQDVKIAGFRRGSYILRHQKGSAGRFFERTLGHSDAAGGSLSGGGVEFLREGGGIIYDSGMGTNADMQVNSPVLLAKQLSQVAVAAVADVRQVPGHESFTPPGYNTLKDVSQYRLRSDGSR
ncbi:MAG: hypothetical protein WCC92_12985 [Candidatus Korobacteraceae bacterium]